MEYLSGVKFDKFIIYSKDINEEDLESLKNGKKQINSLNKNINSIILKDNEYILNEWSEYYIIGVSNYKLSKKDFMYVGNYFGNNFGSVLIKNFIGHIKFVDQVFKVNSYKFSNEALKNLISEVDKRIEKTISLSFSERGVSNAVFEKNLTRFNDYYVYIKLYNSLKSKDIIKNIDRIIKYPNRKFENSKKNVPLSLARDWSRETLMDIFGGQNRLTKGTIKGDSKYFSGIVPEDINEYNNIVSNDTNENRFIKFFLKQCIRILSKFSSDLDQYSKNSQMLIEEVNGFKEELIRRLNSSFFKSISEITSINYSSTILTKQVGYRQIYETYITLKQVPINKLFNSQDLMELYTNKSIDKLYEYICLFRLVDILEEIYQLPNKNEKIEIESNNFYTVSLSEKNNAVVFKFKETEEFCESHLLFQYSYTNNNGGSFSVVFNPDFTLKLIHKNNETFYYHFDSKFRLHQDGKAKNEDIVKMHSYCDGIYNTNGAFVLYPGDKKEIYKKENSQSSRLFGVGFFPLNIRRDKDQYLKEFLMSILSES